MREAATLPSRALSPFLNLGGKAGRRGAAAWSVARGTGAPAGGHTCAAADLAGAGRISRAVACRFGGGGRAEQLQAKLSRGVMYPDERDTCRDVVHHLVAEIMKLFCYGNIMSTI